MKPQGFTLIELIVTVAIAAILLTIGVPSFQETIRNNRVATQTNEFITALNLARSEAIKRGQRVSLCPSAATNSNQTECTGGTNWADGWIVFLDTAANDTEAPVVGEILRVWEAFTGAQLSGPTNIRYRSAGDVISEERLDYSLGSGSHQKMRLLCINRVGRLNVEKKDDTNKCPWES